MSYSPERKDHELADEIEKQADGPVHLDSGARINALDRAPPSLLALSPEERITLEKKLVRKIDITLLPVLMIMYILNYLDRNNIAAARLYGLEKDLGLVGTEYQTSVAILFASYILFQVPSNLMAARVKLPGVYLCLCMAGWGIVSAATAEAQGFGSLVAIRVVLGIFEAAFFPGAVFLLSCWYTKKEMAARTAILFSGSQLGNAFGTLLARAILTIDGAHGIAGWRWLFIIEGVMTVGLALLFILVLPNLPTSNKGSWQFSAIEKDMAVWRLEAEAGDIEVPIGSWTAFKMAASDIKTYYLMGILSLTYVAGAVNSFFPSVVKTLGFSSNMTLILTAPPFLLCVITMYINGWHADRTGDRFWHVAGPLAVTILAMVLAIASTNTGVRYTAMMLMPGSFYAAAIVTLTWISQSMPRPAAKRAAALAFINSFGNTPNIWCSYLYQSSMAPRYAGAFICNIVACGMAITIAFLLKVHLRKENAKMDQGILTKGVTQEMLNVGFRYKH